LNGAQNAGILAAQIIGAFDKTVQKKLDAYKESLKVKVMKGAEEIKRYKST
ncbi:MAG: 5-(carboxyamino)imidazole ribonucleotide mutase, partial [Bacteroidetes bacterium HGW-Bacteroidetes-23]